MIATTTIAPLWSEDSSNAIFNTFWPYVNPVLIGLIILSICGCIMCTFVCSAMANRTYTITHRCNHIISTTLLTPVTSRSTSNKMLKLQTSETLT